jgi:hypothetical protein
MRHTDKEMESNDEPMESLEMAESKRRVDACLAIVVWSLCAYRTGLSLYQYRTRHARTTAALVRDASCRYFHKSHDGSECGQVLLSPGRMGAWA